MSTPNPNISWFKVMWGVLNGIFQLLIPLLAIPFGAKRIDVIVTILYAFVVNFVPQLASKYTNRLGLNATEEEREIVVHCVMTLISTLSFVITLSVLTFITLHTGTDWFRVIYFAVSIIFLFVLVIWAGYNPTGFVGKDAYLQHTCFTFIWPKMIAAPISGFRIALMILTSLLPYVRSAIQQ